MKLKFCYSIRNFTIRLRSLSSSFAEKKEEHTAVPYLIRRGRLVHARVSQQPAGACIKLITQSLSVNRFGRLTLMVNDTLMTLHLHSDQGLGWLLGRIRRRHRRPPCHHRPQGRTKNHFRKYKFCICCALLRYGQRLIMRILNMVEAN